MVKCEICDKEIKLYRSLSKHINLTHKMNVEDYYNKYLNVNNLGYCKKCGNKLKFLGLEIGYKEYCNKCIFKLEEVINKRKNTNIKKYGCENVFQNEEIKQKCKEIIKEKYNVDNISKLDKYKEKKKQTLIKNYGVDHTMKSEKIKEKIRKTNLERYGVEYAISSKVVRNKIKRILKNKYNVNNSYQIKEIKEKSFNTQLEKYGGHPFVSKYILNKAKESNKIRIYNQTKKLLIENNIEIISEKDEYNGKSTSVIYEFKCLKCNHIFKTHLPIRKTIPRCLKCNPYYISKLELEIKEYIQLIYDGEIINNDRIIIGPKELDIVLPELKVAIEVNGTFWHSDKMKPINYHKNKETHCEESGYKLYYIWENDWEENKEETKEKIKNIIFGETNNE